MKINLVKDMLKKHSLFKLDEKRNTIINAGSSFHSTREMIYIIYKLKSLNIQYSVNHIGDIELKL